MNGRSYLSEKRLKKAAATRKALFISGGIIVVLFALMFPLAFTTNPELRPNLTLYGICILPGLFLIWRGLKLRRLIRMANRFNSIFACDRDGFVSLTELTNQCGMGETETLQILEALFQKGFFELCTLHRHGRQGVELTDAGIGDGGEGFLNVECEHCGGTTRLRAGTFGTCEYCGASIRAKTR